MIFDPQSKLFLSSLPMEEGLGEEGVNNLVNTFVDEFEPSEYNKEEDLPVKQQTFKAKVNFLCLISGHEIKND